MAEQEPSSADPDQVLTDPDQVLADLRARLAEIESGAAIVDPPRVAVPADPGAEDDDVDADAESVAHAIVLRQLTAQARTRTELARALQRKNVPPQAASAVLDRMEAVGLVDDADFARSWVESRQRRRNLSGVALRRELRAKGVDAEVVDQAVSTVEPEDEYAAALDLAERKHARMAGLERDVVRRRLSGVLGRRGFGTGVIVRVLGEVLDGPTDHDDV